MIRRGGTGWFARALPAPGPQRALVLSSFVNRMGTGMFLASSVLYFTVVVGLSGKQVGAGLTIAGIVGLLGGVPAGDLADRHGPRTVQLVTLAVQTVTMASFVFVHSWWAFTVVASLDRLADAANNAARGAVIARIGGERPAEFRAKLRTWVNLAVVFGTVGAAAAIQIGTRTAYTALILVNAATYVVCAALLLRVPSYPPLKRPHQERRLAALADRPFVAFAALNGIMDLQGMIVTLLVPLWVTTHTKVPHWTVAAAYGLSFVIGVLLMTRIGGRVETPRQGGTAMRLAGFLTLAACPAIAVTGRLPAWGAVILLLSATALVSIAGVWKISAGFALSFGLAPDHAQGQYQGLNGLGIDAAQAIGPLLLTSLVLGLGSSGWLVLGAVSAALGLAAPVVTAWAERTRPHYINAHAVLASPTATSAP